MTTELIAAVAAGIAVIVSAIFTGIAQLQHNRQYHDPGPGGSPGGPPSPPPPPGSPS